MGEDGFPLLAGPALVDWCEPNGAVVPFVAEFVNAATSVFMMALAAAALWRGRDLEPRFRLGLAGTVLVGLGSAMFHATLLRWAQAADELPMVGLGLTCAWTLSQRRAGPGAGRPLGFGLLAFGLLFAWAYALAPWAFQLFVGVYGVLVLWIAGRTLGLTPSAVARANDGRVA